MVLKELLDVDTVNYKDICMVLGFPRCSFKCDKECGERVCQNSPLANAPDIECGVGSIISRYTDNPLSCAIVMQGLEPLDSFDDVLEFISSLRASGCNDDVVIYTGYNKDEVEDKVEQLKPFGNIVIKFGRFVPGQSPHYDEVLGVNLASDNQYAERI